MKRAIIILIQTLIVLGFFAGWEIGARTGTINPEWFSPPVLVVERLLREVGAGTFPVHIWATTIETLVGFAAGVIGGVALGVVLGTMRRLREVLMPYLLAVYGIPRPALAPVFVLWFGIGLFSKFALIFSLVYFLLVIYVIVGFRSVNPAPIAFARTTGASRRQILFKIIVPSVMPYVFAGMKLGIGMAIVGAVVGEIIASEAGLGYYIYQSSQRADTAGIYVGLAALAVVSLVLVFAMEWLDRRLFHWRREVVL